MSPNPTRDDERIRKVPSRDDLGVGPDQGTDAEGSVRLESRDRCERGDDEMSTRAPLDLLKEASV